jgi:hypothetical protein
MYLLKLCRNLLQRTYGETEGRVIALGEVKPQVLASSKHVQWVRWNFGNSVLSWVEDAINLAPRDISDELYDWLVGILKPIDEDRVVGELDVRECLRSVPFGF